VLTQRIHTSFLYRFRYGARLLLAALTVCIAACGGGGGGGNSSNGVGDTSSLPPAPSQQPIAATAANTVPVTVGTGVAGLPNIPTVTVTVCVAGSNTCATLNNIQLDTASFGLRILASSLPASFVRALPVNGASNGGQLAECTAFADGFTWGTVRNADVKIGGETAGNIPIQLIGDLASNTVPTACSNKGPDQSSTKDLAANGILGVGVSPWDCGSNCADNAATSNYYACPNGANCNNTAVGTSQQVTNPVSRFALDNNGIIVQMQPLSYSGAASAAGTLVFGIGTQSNNVMNASQRFQTTAFGDLSSTFNNRTLGAFLDSGSNALFFSDSALPQCGGTLGTFYCPTSPQSFAAALTGADGSNGSASFSVVSASALLGSNANSGNFAFNDLAGQFGSSTNLDLGLPFFYGRYVYFGQDTTAKGGTQQPFVAF